MIKKLLVIMLSVILVATVLTACGGTNSSSTSTTSTTSTQTDTSPTVAKPTPTATPATLPNPQVTRITADELKQLIDTKADFVLVDDRDAATFASGHIKGAIDIPSYPGGQPLLAQLATLPKDKVIVFYCT